MRYVFYTVDVDARFRRQIIKVMDSTTERVNNRTAQEVKVLFSITREIDTPSSEISGLLIAAQAYFAIRDSERSLFYTEEALNKSRELMDSGEPSGYQVWKSCMLLKGALLYNDKDSSRALVVYEELADHASAHSDVYYLMEARRMCGHLYYSTGEKQAAFEYMLLALASGAYLDMSIRRQSTFLHAAHMALYLCSALRPLCDLDILRSQLREWLGDDWEDVLSASVSPEQEDAVSNSGAVFFQKINDL